MNKIISVLTATRAEYGLLRPIIDRLKGVEEFDVRIVVTGAHLSQEFGLTYREIEEDGFAIDEKIEILLSSDTPASISKSMGLALISFADYFKKRNPDLLIVLGDRYETLAVVIAAMNQRIPIAHLYGGETTEGAIDESIRHAITKMSYLHFTSTQEYRNRIIQLGENPNRVFCVGAIGIENIKKIRLMTKAELQESLNFNLETTYAVVTFHPVTLETNETKKQITALLKACCSVPNMKFIFTKANADADGRIINHMLDEYVSVNKNAIVVDSLGTTRYLSALNYAAMVIGNSSSGLVEAPSFGIPTVNIGDRQRGRLQGDSIINCAPSTKEISRAIQFALSEEFIEIARSAVNPYGDGRVSDQVLDILCRFILEEKIDLKKAFYDLK